MLKRIFALLVCCMLLTSLLPVPALAEEGVDPVSYTVSFESGGAEGTMETLSDVESASVTLPDNAFIKTGFTFAGWKDADGNAYHDCATFTLTGDLVLTAQWKKNCRITFAGGEGATGSVAELTGLEGDSVTLPANTFEKEGHTFVGWKDAEEKTYAPGATVKLEKDLTLTAQWKETITITFAGGEGATGSMAPLSGAKDSSVTLTANAFTKENHIFNGWKDADGKTYAEGATVKLDSNLVLTAQWKERHPHTLGKVNTMAPTCTTAGIREHWKCTLTDCGKLFADELGTEEITDVSVPATHSLTAVAQVDPTYTTPGTKAHKTCSGCTKLFTPEEQETTAEALVIPQLITVSGNIADVSAGAMEKANDGLGNVTLDLNSAVFVGNPAAGLIHYAKLPVSGLGDLTSLTVHMADGSVVFDKNALADIAEQADCAQVTLYLDEYEFSDLTQLQRNALKKYDVVKVVEISLTDCEGNAINTAESGGFGTGTVKLTLSGITKTKNNIYYKYLDEKGNIKGIAGTYSSTRKTGTLHLLNTGDHVVVRLKADTSNPATGDSSNIKLWIGLMAGSAVALAIVVILMTRKTRKKK